MSLRISSRSLAFFCAFTVSLWHVVWWGLVSPDIRSPSLHVREYPQVEILDLNEVGRGEMRFQVESLRSPTTFSLPGGPGFSSFLVMDRGGLSPVLQPENLAFPLKRKQQEDVGTALPMASFDGASRWLSRIPPVSSFRSITRSLPALPTVRYSLEGFRADQLEKTEWERMASWSTNQFWRASVEVEFSKGRPVALFFDPESTRNPSVSVPLRAFLMQLRTRDPEAAFLGRVNLQVYKKEPVATGVSAP